MKLVNQIKYALDDADDGKLDSALLHACTSIDAVSRLLFPRRTAVGIRYTETLRRYYWLLQRMMGNGPDIEKTLFSNVTCLKKSPPDFADIIYEQFRCTHAHGEDVPRAFELILATDQLAKWRLAANVVQMPTRIIYALLSVAVLCRETPVADLDIGYHLSLHGEIFPIVNWWGREDDFRKATEKYEPIKVKMEGL